MQDVPSQPTLLVWRIANQPETATGFDPIALLESYNALIAETVSHQPVALFQHAILATNAACNLQKISRAASIDMVIALHHGEYVHADGLVVGSAIHRAQTLLQAGNAPQIILSHATAELLAPDLPEQCELVPLGSHRLFDLLAPQPLFELCLPNQPAHGTLTTLDHFQHNLPLQPTPFIGRSTAITTMSELLTSGQIRLLTLVATSGTGKTRFSLEIAARLLSHYRDGITFVALAAVNDPQLVLSQIARALGVRESSARPLRSQLADYLRDRHMLLILDNFEQVLASANIVAELLHETNLLQVVVTSHVPLRVADEHVQYVPPMDLPNPERPTTIANLVHYDAVALFVERAQAVLPSFTINAENQALVSALVARLGGLPLSIDLVAAMLEIIDLPTLLYELGDYKLGAMPLPMVLEWSYRRLPAETRQVFGRLGVFAGGCTLDVAEQICRVGNERLDVATQLQLLMRRNLLFPEQLRIGMVRYIMLDTIHDQARRYLVGQEEVEILARRHSNFYIELARQAYAGLHGEQQSDWLLRLESEQHNMRQAFQWAMNNQHYEIAGQFVASLGRYWHIRGAFSEGQRWVDSVLPVCSVLSTTLQAQVLNVATFIFGEQGFYDRAEITVRRALELHQANANQEGEYHALNNLGVLKVFLNEFDQAAGFYEQALVLARTLGSARLQALSLNNLGDLAMERGDYGNASGYLEEALELARQSGDLFRVIDLLNSLGWAALAGQTITTARDYFREGLVHCRDMRSVTHIPEFLEGSAGVLHGTNAANMLGAAEALREETGSALPDVYAERLHSIKHAIQQALTPDAYERAVTEGRALNATQATALALRLLEAA